MLKWQEFRVQIFHYSATPFNKNELFMFLQRFKKILWKDHLSSIRQTLNLKTNFIADVPNGSTSINEPFVRDAAPLTNCGRDLNGKQLAHFQNENHCQFKSHLISVCYSEQTWLKAHLFFFFLRFNSLSQIRVTVCQQWHDSVYPRPWLILDYLQLNLQV